MTIEPAVYSDILKIINDLDPRVGKGESTDGLETAPLVRTLDDYFEAGREGTYTVLGMDIYQYSAFDNQRQRIIPVIFKNLYRAAVAQCNAHESYLFQADQFTNRFVPTGDGGFLVFDTPIHALAYALWFQMELTAFNSAFVTPRLRRFLGTPLTLRYAITLDTLVRFEDNWFGPAIINNARILSRDSLNRCLLDSNVADWYSLRLGSFDTLLALQLPSPQPIPEFASYSSTNKQSMMFTRPPQVHTAMLQKIGAISAKGTTLDVYSAYVQVGLLRGRGQAPPDEDIVASIGNLNTSGLARRDERSN